MTAFEKKCQAISEALAKAEIKIHRESITGDGSKLFQLYEGKACFDYYPSGTLVMCIVNGEGDDWYELRFKHLHRSIQILKGHFKP